MDVNMGSLSGELYTYLVLIFVSCVGHKVQTQYKHTYTNKLFILIIIINNRHAVSIEYCVVINFLINVITVLILFKIHLYNIIIHQFLLSLTIFIFFRLLL